MKKVITIFLSLILVFCNLGLNDISFAEEDTYENLEYDYGDFRYMVSNSYAKITRFDGKGDNIVIPKTIYGKEVTEIGEYAFSNCTNLKSVEIPNTVIKIGEHAFSNCVNLKNIEIPNTITEIGEYAFSYCEGLKNINIPNGIKTIEERTFYNCISLENIEIPHTVTSIKSGAFWECINLKDIEIPDSVIELESAFYGCKNLKSIKLPKNITYIDVYSFNGCYELESIEMPKNIKSIGKYAFYDCTNLKSIDIPDTVTEIGEWAFRGCESLKEIKMPNELKDIKGFAFCCCTGIKNIEIPKSVISIGERAFESCSNLESAKIPNTVKNIDPTSFGWCDKLIIYGPSDSYVEKYAKDNNIPFIATTISLSSSDIKVNSIVNQPYTGNEIEPNLVIKYKDKVLTKNVDYKLSYKNNISVGIATVNITGMGQYTGSKKVTFKIVPKTVTGVKQTERTTSKIKLTWNKSSKASGYYIYRATSKDGKYTKIATVTGYSKNYYTDSNLSSGKIYYYKIRSYRKEDSKYYYGNYSDAYTASTKCLRPSITLTSPKTKTINVSWKKVNGADGYAVYRSTSKSGTYSLKKTIIKGSTLSYTNTGLTKNKTYYYKVKAYKIVDGKKIYSDYSLVKYIKCR